MQSPHRFLLLAFLVVSSTSVNGNTELTALMEIKSSLDPESNYLSSWTATGDPCDGSFEGVACNEDLKVANISLQGKGLTGTVPPAVAQLESLTGLYLHYNALRGEIPREIANLTQLTDLYLDVNNLTGLIPPEIGSMASLQVLQLSCNNLTGTIPPALGFLTRLTVLSLERNQLTGNVPASLANSGTLNRLYLSFNHLSGPIPARLAGVSSLEVLDLQSNSLSGVVPSGFLRLKEGFRIGNNSGLCGSGFPSLRACSVWDNGNVSPVDTPASTAPNPTIVLPKPVDFNKKSATKSSSSSSSYSQRLQRLCIVMGSVVGAVAAIAVAVVLVFQHCRPKPNASSVIQPSSPLDSHENSMKTDTVFAEQQDLWGEWGSTRFQAFNMEAVLSATQHFSERNLLGKSGKFSAVYRGVLRDGSVVAIKRINKTSCKSEEDGFADGLSLLESLKHENLVRLKGFCCSTDRGECFLIYEFAPNGSLCGYLHDEQRSIIVLDWPTRVSFLLGIAKGIEYLHREEGEKRSMIHSNISVEKVVLDENWRPLILDAGFPRLLADDVVYSAIKVSAALGYMAPEYVTTGRFTEKSDVYAFGVIVLQVLSGRKMLSSSTRAAAVEGKWEELIGPELEFSRSEAARLGKIALDCTNEMPEDRPTMADVVSELNGGGEGMRAGN